MKKCNEKMEIYSRVVGYYSPTNRWNNGKQEEFAQRKTFDINKSLDKIQNEEKNENNPEKSHNCE
jgi:ribonucleoside-triphosphate reductase